MGTKNNPGEWDCYSRAEPDEPMFVLLARDKMAPKIVRQWALEKRAELDEMGGLSPTELSRRRKKLDEALTCAFEMEEYWRYKVGK